ncbi:FHA domain-containing protein [Pajaroellobacter abortibovis]|uniref:FHA domain-containing protein n=1 Tax=Pajaroellobacter abortibovis TaxID=1882918 RepID=A0A1L6MY82_9BACT|nr:FHA domain-containing protein [Pajaroellobacter abortibovis]APS00531.1 hypothetical protein BCY86_07470 [Pajaroellobacter abortibovis]
MDKNSHLILFRIYYPNGRREEISVESNEALIGSGSYCEIRLPPELASEEHIFIKLEGRELRIQTRSLKPIPTFNGTPFQEITIHSEGVIGIGAVKIQLNLSFPTEDIAVRRRKDKGSSIVKVGGTSVCFVLILFLLFYDQGSKKTEPPPKEAPPLWGPPITQCPYDLPDQALAAAYEKKVIAEGKRERHPFHVQDGVAAVPLFETAATCFKTGGDAEAANEQAQAAASLRKEINIDYHTHQVRLEHALSIEDFAWCQKEIRVLRALTEGVSGPYVTWLNNIDRQLQLKITKEQSS